MDYHDLCLFISLITAKWLDPVTISDVEECCRYNQWCKNTTWHFKWVQHEVCALPFYKYDTKSFHFLRLYFKSMSSVLGCVHLPRTCHRRNRSVKGLAYHVKTELPHPNFLTFRWESSKAGNRANHRHSFITITEPCLWTSLRFPAMELSHL